MANAGSTYSWQMNTIAEYEQREHDIFRDILTSGPQGMTWADWSRACEWTEWAHKDLGVIFH